MSRCRRTDYARPQRPDPWKDVMGSRGELFSTRATTPKRTYFFNVKENRHGDVFLNLVESKKATESDFQRQSIVVFGWLPGKGRLKPWTCWGPPLPSSAHQ